MTEVDTISYEHDFMREDEYHSISSGRKSFIQGEEQQVRSASSMTDSVEYEKVLDHSNCLLMIQSQSLGEKDLSVGNICSNIAMLYVSQGLYEKALTYYEKDLLILLEVFGGNHPDVGVTYSNIAGVLKVCLMITVFSAFISILLILYHHCRVWVGMTKLSNIMSAHCKLFPKLLVRSTP